MNIPIVLQLNICMRIKEITVQEDPVASSWISDLTLQNNQSDVTMALGDGKRYVIKGLGEAVYNAWLQSSSKGEFWHDRVKDQYPVQRLV